MSGRHVRELRPVTTVGYRAMSAMCGGDRLRLGRYTAGIASYALVAAVLTSGDAAAVEAIEVRSGNGMTVVSAPPLPYPHPLRASPSRKASTARAAAEIARERETAKFEAATLETAALQAARLAAARADAEQRESARQRTQQENSDTRPAGTQPAAQIAAPAVTPTSATASPAEPESPPDPVRPSVAEPMPPLPTQSPSSTSPAKTEAAVAAEPPRWTDAEIEAAARECDELLQPIGAKTEPIAPIRQGECGTPAPVKVASIGSSGGVAIEPAAILNCRMVSRLHQWIETVAQPAAREKFGARIVKVTNASAYICRNRYNDPAAKISEHAFANALDVSAFVLSDGRRIDVKTFWGDAVAAAEKAAAAKAAAERAAAEKAAEAKVAAEKASFRADAPANKAGTVPPVPAKASADLAKKAVTAGLATELGTVTGRRRAGAGRAQTRVDAAASTPEQAFLNNLHSAACGIFSTVLGPQANSAHRDHFHLDLKQRRHASICE